MILFGIAQLRLLRRLILLMITGLVSMVSRQNYKKMSYFLTDLNTLTWIASGFQMPASPIVKRRVLERYSLPSATWVETGTYLGDTTHFLSSIAKKIHTIEPDLVLHTNAVKRFREVSTVECIHGTSEEIFPKLIPILTGDICFWLDGHYSSGITFQGDRDTPIIEEFEIIRKSLGNYGNVVIFVDDVRCFNPTIPEYADYPSITWLANQAETMKMSWRIEHDIFMCWN